MTAPAPTATTSPYRRYDPNTAYHTVYLHVDPRTGLLTTPTRKD